MTLSVHICGQPVTCSSQPSWGLSCMVLRSISLRVRDLRPLGPPTGVSPCGRCHCGSWLYQYPASRPIYYPYFHFTSCSNYHSNTEHREGRGLLMRRRRFRWVPFPTGMCRGCLLLLSRKGGSTFLLLPSGLIHHPELDGWASPSPGGARDAVRRREGSS